MSKKEVVMGCKEVIIVATVSCLVACSPNADTPMSKQVPSTVVQPNPRIQVTRIGVVDDDIAYGSRRGIYIIKDNNTGKEYFGISGVGITDQGSHSNGKTSSEDER